MASRGNHWPRDLGRYSTQNCTPVKENATRRVEALTNRKTLGIVDYPTGRVGGDNDMKFGLFMFPIHQPRENSTLGVESDLQIIELADELDYDEVWVGEHHTTGWETIASP